MNNDLWAPKRRIEASFLRALNKIARRIIRIVKDCKGDFDAMQNSLLEFARTRLFHKLCRAAAMKMVTGLFADQGRTWRQAAAIHGQGRIIYEALKKELVGDTGKTVNRLVEENAALIRTLPRDIADEVARYVSRETFKGRRASELEDEIQRRFPTYTRARAKLIARTQVSMTQTDLIRARCEKFGRRWYVWRPIGGSQGDGRTRKSHRGMSGVICAWTDPPAPETLFPEKNKDGRPRRSTLGHYHPGQCPNCRCYPEPIINLDIYEWPMKVYRHNKIQRMSKRAFESIM